MNKVKTFLENEKHYDFSEPKWTGKQLSLLYDVVYATEAVMIGDTLSENVAEPSSVEITSGNNTIKQRLLKVLSVPVFVVAFLPIMLAKAVLWVVKGGTSPIKFVDAYFDWLIK